MRGLVEGDAAFQLVLADVAPRTDGVRGDVDVEVCHFAEVGSQDVLPVECVKIANVESVEKLYIGR